MTGRCLAALIALALMAGALALFVSTRTEAQDPDTDGDWWSDADEVYLGTDPLDNCPPPANAWPLDQNGDGTISVSGDVAKYAGKIGLLNTDPGWTPAVQRLDLNVDGIISMVSDVGVFYRGMVNKSCNGGTPQSPSWTEGAPLTMDIDPEITGNDADSLGTVEDCYEVTCPSAECTWDGSSTFDGLSDYSIDIVVMGDPPGPMGYDASLVFGSSRVNIAGADPLIKLPGGTSFSGTLPDTVSPYPVNAFLMSGGPGTGGNGALVRIGLDIGALGLVGFSLNAPPRTTYASDGNLHPVAIDPGFLAINTDCPDPVGGIAELPQVGDSGAADNIALAAGAITALALALTAGAWYARRRRVS